MVEYYFDWVIQPVADCLLLKTVAKIIKGGMIVIYDIYVEMTQKLRLLSRKL